MEFADLNDEIGADDWLISSEEITRRRLIRQTSRYNVYKADWYGDVLVYEPRTEECEASRKQQYHRNGKINQEELKYRLNRLNLNYDINNSTSYSILSYGSQCNSEQTDSAYSSISSTPRHNTKSPESGFEFDFATSQPGSPTLKSSSPQIKDKINNDSVQSDDKISISEMIDNVADKKEESINNLEKPVVLNRDSYNLGRPRFSNESLSKSSWFELNELRLVAHESFLLFMGASMDQVDGDLQSSTSLVMQMNHPKAVSLYYLLHGMNSDCNPTIDRFFTYKQQRLQLNTGTKLNICQQVINGMTYLHEKNIVHGKLTSVNIYLEQNQRVKISLIDDDERAIATTCGNHNQTNSVELNLPSLTYLSPELIKTITLVNGATKGCDISSSAHVQFDTSQLTRASDIFSLGTLLYELFGERFPFAKAQDTITFMDSLKLSILDSPLVSPLKSARKHWNGNIEISANELIYQIGSGHIKGKNLSHRNKIKLPRLIESIIEKCWSTNPLMRPQFKQLATAL